MMNTSFVAPSTNIAVDMRPPTAAVLIGYRRKKAGESTRFFTSNLRHRCKPFGLMNANRPPPVYGSGVMQVPVVNVMPDPP
jgi:hypothetical protein